MDSQSIAKELVQGGSVGFCGLGSVAMVAGMDQSIAGGFTVMWGLIVAVVLLVLGAIFWASRAAKAKGFGQLLMMIGAIVLVLVLVVVAVSPASVAPGDVAGDATFEVLSVANVGGATYSQASKTLTVSATINTTADTISPTQLTLNATVQRTDAGETTDIKTVSASVAQNSRTDPTTGLTYKCIASNSFGVPNVDWTMTTTSATSATDTLTAQMGLTPYATGVFNVTINWNANAFTTSDVQLSDVIYAGTLTIGAEVYTIQVVISTINT